MHAQPPGLVEGTRQLDELTIAAALDEDLDRAPLLIARSAATKQSRCKERSLLDRREDSEPMHPDCFVARCARSSQ
jgi:hypothetical protein